MIFLGGERWVVLRGFGSVFFHQGRHRVWGEGRSDSCERVLGVTLAFFHPDAQQRHHIGTQGRSSSLDTSNAKLVFRTALVCDAAGSGLYLKAKYARRSVRPLRRNGDDV